MPRKPGVAGLFKRAITLFLGKPISIKSTNKGETHYGLNIRKLSVEIVRMTEDQRIEAIGELNALVGGLASRQVLMRDKKGQREIR